MRKPATKEPRWIDILRRVARQPAAGERGLELVTREVARRVRRKDEPSDSFYAAADGPNASDEKNAREQGPHRPQERRRGFEQDLQRCRPRRAQLGKPGNDYERTRHHVCEPDDEPRQTVE